MHSIQQYIGIVEILYLGAPAKNWQAVTDMGVCALPACLNVIACLSFCLLAYSLYALHWSLVLACIA
jgi:hypothetical protein